MDTVTKPGYKQTELGWIPEEWEVSKLGVVYSFKQGFQVPIDQQSSSEKSGLMRFIRIIDLTQKDEEPRFIIDPGVQHHVFDDDIFMVRYGSPGLLGYGYKGIIANNLFRLNPKQKTLNKYFFYFLGFRNSEILKISSLTTMAAINFSALKEIKVVFPKYISEQQAIATALSDIDSYISSLESLIAKKRMIKQGAMQELLTPKEDWEVRKLGEVGETIIGLTYKPENINSDGILVLRSSNIQEGKLVYDDNVFVNIEVLERLILRENDLLICVRNGSRKLIGKCALITGIAIGETFGAFMSVFRSKFNPFIIHLFKSNFIKKQIDEYLGATINQITNKSLNSFEIPFPPLDVQNHIASILNEMEYEIDSLGLLFQKTQKIKQGMMQDLLTGKVRLV